MDTYLPSHKSSKWNEQNLQDTVEEVRRNPEVTFSYEPLHMDELVLIDQQKLTNNRPVRTQDAEYKRLGESDRQ